MSNNNQYVFSLPKARLEKTKNPNELIMDKYSFKDGKMTVMGEDGPLIARILCEYYGCTMEVVDLTPKKGADDQKDPTLAKSATKA